MAQAKMHLPHRRDLAGLNPDNSTAICDSLRREKLASALREGGRVHYSPSRVN